MKKLILTLLLLNILSFAKAQTPVSDTLLYVSNPDRVVITESPEGTRVSISDSGESVLIAYPDSAKISTYRRSSTLPFNLPFGYGKKGSESCGSSCDGWTVGFDGLCIGLNNALGQTGGGGLQWSKSFEINWLSCLNVGYAFSRSRIYLGLGFDWRNYKATADGRWLQPKDSIERKRGFKEGEIDKVDYLSRLIEDGQESHAALTGPAYSRIAALAGSDGDASAMADTSDTAVERGIGDDSASEIAVGQGTEEPAGVIDDEEGHVATGEIVEPPECLTQCGAAVDDMSFHIHSLIRRFGVSPQTSIQSPWHTAWPRPGGAPS